MDIEKDTPDGVEELRVQIIPANVNTNANAMQVWLETQLRKHENVEFTEENLVEVKAAKTFVRSLRTGIEAKEKEAKKVFDTAKKGFSATIAPLYDLIQRLESRCDEVLEAADAKRVEKLNVIFDDYIEEFGKDLRDEYKAKIVRDKRWYNVTQKEADTVNEIKALCLTLKKEQREADAAQAMVTKKAADAGLSPAPYLALLQTGVSAFEVVNMIDGAAKPKEVPAEEKVTLGAPVSEPLAKALEGRDFTADLPQRTKRAVIELVYPAELADEMSELFAMVAKRGVKVKMLERG